MLIVSFGKSMKLNIFYIGPFDFLNGGAAVRRIMGNIKTLNNIGARVTVIDGKHIKSSTVINGTPLISLQERPNPDSHLLLKLVKYLCIGKNSIEYIRREPVKPDVIILYSGYSPYLLKLIKYCKQNNIKLIFDCVEWYLPKNKLVYLYNPYYWNVEFSMRFLIKKCDGIICISKYLEDYYFKEKVKTINIPPTLSLIDMPRKSKVEFNGKIKLVYTGSPGHKDKLGDIIAIITKLSDKFELDIAGIEGSNTDNIRYHGLLSHANSLELVSKSHFSILFRPDNKVSKAGFSTKVVESMSCGTPVITNRTGDLDNFISDGNNGYIFDGYSSNELYSKLNEISKLFNCSYYKNITNKALYTARECFESDLYSENLKKFLINL
jgi:glycosyltransferase involved in cell wall biosynthesis